FEIAYPDGRTIYLQADFGAIPHLTPEMLPADLAQFSLVHVTPLGDPARQLAFIHACRQRGSQRIAAGTSFVFIENQAATIREIIAAVDYFFMNEREAVALFGDLANARTAAGKVLFITLGARGVLVVLGEHAEDIPVRPVPEFDPTGAGDSFCGSTLAFLGQKQHPGLAARRALPLVTAMIGQPGPAGLLTDGPVPEPVLDERVQLNESRLAQVAAAIARFPGTTPHNFVTEALPPVNHPAALDYFFAATLQQFSFWYAEDNHYDQPMYGTINGKRYKGSEYLWMAFWRHQAVNPGFGAPAGQAALTESTLRDLMRADDGSDLLPALDLHLEQARAYGQDMLALGLTPQAIIAEASASERPLQTFLARLDQIGGYKEDPLRKKSNLLAIILNQRPEGFLPFAAGEDVSPVMDYHAMRACLRVGLVEVVDEALRTSLINRCIISPADEWAVRLACYRAYEQLVSRSGKRYGAVGWFLFSSMRRYCLEMGLPDCASCHLETVCAQRRELFQPILRTAFY
ncbi:MAG: hypothetical protein KDE28_29890, partial [Anaerolineales bacterium]|nr:hypothetical protein [Anaerolineales bacterium]